MVFLAMLYFVITILGGLFEGDLTEGHDGSSHMDSYDAGFDGGSEHHFLHHDTAVSHDNAHGDDGDNVSGSGSFDLFNTRRRCPFTFAITAFLLIWGIGGYMCSIFELSLLPIGSYPVIAPLITVFLSGFIAVMIVRQIAPIIAKTLPYGHGSTNKYDLIGMQANPSTMLAPGKVGYIEVCVSGGGVINKLARLDGGSETLGRKDSVYITDYDYETDLYIVVPAPHLTGV
jgi:hypothetical protein